MAPIAPTPRDLSALIDSDFSERERTKPSRKSALVARSALDACFLKINRLLSVCRTLRQECLLSLTIHYENDALCKDTTK